MAALDQTYGVKYASITGTDDVAPVTLVDAVEGAKIHVLGFMVNATIATTVKFQSKAADAVAINLTGATGLSLAINGVAASGYSPFGWFATETGAALQLQVGITSAVSGFICYVVEPQ